MDGETNLGCVRYRGILNMYWCYNLGGISTELDSCFRRNDDLIISAC